MRLIKIIIVLTLALTALNTLAKKYNLTSFTQDNTGYIYGTSHVGLIRFDGHQYREMSTFTDLPSDWSESAVYQKSTNTLYIAFLKHGIWSLNLNNNQSSQISDLEAQKITLSDTHIMAQVDAKLFMIDLLNYEQRQPFNQGGVLDIATHKSNHYAITATGLYQVNSQQARLIKSHSASKAKLAAFPQHLVYSTDDKLHSISKRSNKQTTKKHSGYITSITAYNVDSVAVASLGNINLYGILDLQLMRANINTKSQINESLFIDNDQNLWASDKVNFEIIDQQNSVISLPIVSRYNVLESINDDIWLGTEQGLYKSSTNGIEPLTHINNQLAESTRSITDIIHFNKSIYFSTTAGIFKLEDAKIEQLYDGYVLALHNIDNELIASTTKGVVGFNSELHSINFDSLNTSLPSKEVLYVTKINDVLYAATAKGLVEKTSTTTIIHQISTHNITSVFLHQGAIYATTWGGGLYKKTGKTWHSIASPLNISSAGEVSKSIYFSYQFRFVPSE